jgi:hypothetical protein
MRRGQLAARQVQWGGQLFVPTSPSIVHISNLSAEHPAHLTLWN